MLKKLLKEISDHKLTYLSLFIILGLGLFLRVYNIERLLGFHFDQGRDALIIWDLWHSGDVPFIGPTTGIAGIFRGPFYYYLIAPFYLLGRGNPVWPSVFLSLTTVIASLLMYYLGYKIQNRITGLIAALLSSLSFNIVAASRWLSNPTPMLFLSVLFVWMLILIVEKKVWAWIPAIFIASISLFHFGSAGEVFYFPALLIILFWQRKKLPNKKIIILSILSFLISVLPLIAFDIKNKGILSGNIGKFLITDKSFSLPSWAMVFEKIYFYYNTFTNKIFNARYYLEKTVLSTVLILFVYHFKNLFKKNGVKVLAILLSSVCLGLIFFQGNFGNIYDYYLTGYYLPFLLLFSIVLGYLVRFKLGTIFVVYFIYLFMTNNFDVLHFKYWDKSQGPNSIGFINQKEVVRWIYQDAGENIFNVDVYVPPVISYSYDYLLKWLPTTDEYKSYDGKKVDENVSLLYTLYESDSDHQERLDSWLLRQKKIGKVIDEFKSGSITVQRRLRL